MTIKPSHRLQAGLSQRGFSIVEALVSVAIAMVTLAGIMLSNSQALKMVWSSRQSNAATLCLQERVEQLRIAHWMQITDSSYLLGGFLSTVPASAIPIQDMTETVTVSAYPDPSVAPAIVVRRTPEGSVVVSDSETLGDHPLARVDLQVAWTSDGRTRVRESSTVIAKTGISQLNLAMTGGGTSDGGTPETAPDPDATPDPDGTDPDSGSTTDDGTGSGETETETSNGNGHGKGRGNIGGQSGQG